MLFAEVRCEGSPAGRQSGVLASKESLLAVVSYKTTLNINGVGVGGRKDSMDVVGAWVQQGREGSKEITTMLSNFKCVLIRS